MAPESTENNMILNSSIYISCCRNAPYYTLWRTYRIFGTDVRFPTFLHMTIIKLTKLKGSTSFQLFSFYVKDKQQKGNNSSSFKCRLVKRDDILQINLIYLSPHHKNKFVNSVNSLKNSLAALAETKEKEMLDFTRSGLPNVSQSK